MRGHAVVPSALFLCFSGVCVCVQVAKQQGDYLAELFANNDITGTTATTVIKPSQEVFMYRHKVRAPHTRIRTHRHATNNTLQTTRYKQTHVHMHTREDIGYRCPCTGLRQCERGGARWQRVCKTHTRDPL